MSYSMVPVKILAILLLVGTVTKFGHPLRAAVVYGAIAAGLELLGGNAVQSALVEAGISFAIAGLVFWLIDRTQSIILGTVVTIGGVAVLLLFG